MIILGSVSVVSASDLNTTDDAVKLADLNDEKISLNDDVECNVLQEDIGDNNTEISENNDYKTFIDIQNAIDSMDDGQRLELSGTYYGSGVPIIINKSIDIVGTGNGAVLKANVNSSYKSNIFYIYGTSNVLINNLKLSCGDSSWGGSIIVYGDNCTVSNCEFEENVANGNSGYGGAIFWWGNNGVITNCNFTNNHCSDYGGAIYINGENSKISNCIFNNNYVSNSLSNWQGGGAIYNDCQGLIIDNCIFSANYANGSKGGALHLSDASVTIKNSFFMNNNALNGKVISDYSVGEVFNNTFIVGLDENEEYLFNGMNISKLKSNNNFIYSQPFTHLNLLINNNNDSVIYLLNNYTFLSIDSDLTEGIIIDRNVTIRGNGFTINADNKAKIFKIAKGNVVFEDIIFTNGKTTHYGGVIEGECTVVNCTFVGNSANRNGGVLYGGSAVNCTFIDNKADSGGAIYFNSGGTVVNCIFINNSASWNGGAIYFSSGGSAVNCTFVNNSAYQASNSYGGALYGGGAMNCTFVGNFANAGGGAVYGTTYISNHNITNCIFLNNSAKNGGAVYNGFAINCTFKNNNATENGGSMYNSLAINCIFLNNSASSGGAVFDSAVLNSIFESNSAVNNGGAMDSGSAINCTFNDNHAKRFGGAVSNARVSKNSKFNNNSANNGNDMYNATYLILSEKTFVHLNNLINSNNFSEIYIDDNYTFDLSSEFDFLNGITINRNITIYGNGHTIDGANAARIFNVNNTNAIFHDIIFIGGKNIIGGAINGALSVINCTFIDNEANSGGAMYGGGAVNCTFVGNSANLYGGAFYNGNAVNCTFIDNHVDLYGGALYRGGAVNCTFVGNSARGFGGALYNGNAVNCIFENNQAGQEGGAIYALTVNSYYFNCSFVNNSAGSSHSYISNSNGGGAIFCGNPSTIENCQFYGNEAISCGGGAVNVEHDVTFKNCSFADNSAYWGGAVNSYPWGRKSGVNFDNCKFYNNHASYYGGALYGEHGFGSISNSTFMNNYAGVKGFAIYSDNEKDWLRKYYSEGQISGCKFINNTVNSIYLESGRNLIIDCIFDVFPTEEYGYNSMVDFGGNNNFLIVNLYTVAGPLVNKTITFNFNETNYTINTDSKGLAVINYDNYLTEEGNYMIYINYDGDDINHAVSNVVPITFSLKHDPILTLDDLEIYVGEEGYLIANLSYFNEQLFSKTITFNVNGIDYNQTTDSKGIAKFKITDYLTSFGTYNVEISFAGDDNYNSVSTNVSVIISKYDSNLNVENLSFFVGEDCYFVADLSDARGKLSNKTVTFNVGNVNYNIVTDFDGQAKIKITDYVSDYGSYDVGVSFVGDNFDNPISTTANIVLNRYDSILNVGESSFIRGEDGYLVVNLSDIRGSLSNKNVIFMINNKRYIRSTDSNGIAMINIADCLTTYGYYTVGVDFSGDNFNKPVSANVDVSIVNYKGILTVNQVGKYYGGTNLTFNLINSKTNLPIPNTVIELTFSNGVSDKVSTDSEGNANYELSSSLFTPDSYVVNASVSIPYVDINAAVKDFVVSEFVGEIEISQAEDCRVLNIRLFNPETGDIFKNFVVNLAFTNNGNVVDVKTDENGVVNYTMSNFDEGTYSVRASVKDPYTQFTPKTLEFIINNKGNSLVSFVPKQLTFDYLGSGTIGLYLNWCSVDLVNISVVDHPEAIIGIDENDIIIVSNLTSGSYTLQVTSTPYENYNPVTRTTTITVNKIDSFIYLTPLSFDYGKFGSIDVDVNGCDIELENIQVLNHPEAVISLNGNKISVSNLSVGTYVLQVISSPDENHYAVTKNTTITVNKVDSSLSLTPLSFDYTQTGYSNVSVVGGSVLRSNIEVLNHPDANINIYNNVISVSGLDAGTYTLQVTSSPDDNHKAVTKTVGITVNKVDSSLTFTKAIIFDYGGSDSTSIDFSGCSIQSNNIKVLNHPEAIISFTGKVITVSGLDEGSYTLQVTSSPDDNHNAVSRTISVTVNKIDSNIRFTRELSFDYGGSDSTVLVLDGCSVSLSNISVIGHSEAKITLNGDEVTVSGLDAGSYTLCIITTPNKNYKSVTKTTDIVVNKIDSTIDFSEEVLVFDQGDSASVKITVGGGNVGEIVVDNHPEAIITNNGDEFTISNLNYGSYTLNVVSNPDKNHDAVSKSLDITVNKMLSNVTFGGDIVFDYGNTGSTWIKVTGGGVSPSDIIVVGHSEAEITMTSNNIIYVSNLAVGSYILKVITTPDENHRSVEANIAVVVNKADSTVEFNDISFDYGMSGSTSVSVNGGKLLLSDISVVGQSDAKIMYNGKSITVSDLDAGSYILSVVTTPDNNHNAVNATVNVYVNKVDSVLVLSDDIIFDYGGSGSTVITAGGDDVSLSGISVIGEKDAIISLNNYKITVSGLDAGNYTLRVTTTPDKNHNPITRNVDISVNKVDSIIGLTNAVIFDYGGFASTNATVIGGDIKYSGISVDNHDEAKISLNGREITVSNLGAGTYILRVISNPDKNHNSVTGTTSIIVNKVDSDFTLNNNVSFNYGKSGSVTVDVYGCSIVKSGISVDNHNEAIIDIKDNVITVSNLAVGSYTLRVVSTPDSNHNPVTKTVGIVVNKSDSNIGFTNEVSFDYGSVGTTTLILDGCRVDESDIHVVGYDAKININENNVVTVSGLDVGNYTLSVTSVPDANHDAVINTTKITVNSVDSVIGFNKDLISFGYGGSDSVSVTVVGGRVLPGGASVVGHSEANVTVKGNIITVSNLPVGDYVLMVTSSPDANHRAVTEKVNVSVMKVDSSISLKPIVFDYGGSGSTTLTLKGCTQVSDIKVVGYPNAPVSIKDNVITVSGLNVNTYTLSVTSVPDANHNAVTKTTTITVNRIDSSIRCDNDVVFGYGGSGSTHVTVVGGNIVDGLASVVDYDDAVVKVSNNVVTVSNLPVGEYTLKVTSSPDGNHKAVSNTTTIRVNKVNSTVEFSNPVVFDYGGSGTTTLFLDGCTVSKIGVEGYPNVPVEITDNNVVTVSGLVNGVYTLEVTTAPDSNHWAVTNWTTITVNKVDSSVSFSKKTISFKYAKSRSVVLTLDGCSVDVNKISVVGKKAKLNLKGNVLTVSGLPVGTYTLKVVTVPDAHHKSVTRTIKVKVTKNTAKISAKAKTVAVKKATNWAVTLKDSSGKPISKVKVLLKVYTGKKFVKVTKKTNAKGVVNYNTKNLKLGTHKIVVSFSHKGYNCKAVKSSVKVIKPRALVFEVNPEKLSKGGASLTVLVKDKATKKYVNGVKVNFLIKTGSKVKKVQLISGKYNGQGGVVAYATNMLSKGKHAVQIVTADVKYTGSASSSMVIKKSVKNGWYLTVSKGKKTTFGVVDEKGIK